jgi:hypothetical protein
MEGKPSKSLDGAATNLKRKWDTRCVADLTGVLTPTSVVAKQTRLIGDVCKPDGYGASISRSFVRYYIKYKNSGMPERLMFYKNNQWLDYPEEVVDLVKKDFKIKKGAVEVELNGQEVVLDFLHMYHVELKTGLQQPIGWIDEEGNHFFPEVFAGSTDEPNNISEQKGGESLDAKDQHEIKLHLSNKINGEDESKLGGYSWESEAATDDVKADGHNITNKMGGGKVGIDFKLDLNIDLDDYTESGYGKLDVISAQKLFLTGMTALGITESHIIEIYRSSGRLMQRRLDLFQKQADITKGARGDANVRYAWLACSKEELSIMMKYGVGHYELSPSKCKYGFGVHLAAVTYPYLWFVII